MKVELINRKFTLGSPNGYSRIQSNVCIFLSLITCKIVNIEGFSMICNCALNKIHAGLSTSVVVTICL
jgi:hypothetical protein